MPRLPLPRAPAARTAARALVARDHEEHRATMAQLRESIAMIRALLPERHRERHREARDLSRPIARPPRAERPRCGARCRDGHPCTAPVVWNAGEETPRRRCRVHGGLSTGPRTPAGRARSLAAIGQRPRQCAEWDTASRRLRTVDGCSACLIASRRCRSASAWLVRQNRAHGHVTPDDITRVVRWTRCDEHAQEQLAALARAGYRWASVELSRPCA